MAYTCIFIFVGGDQKEPRGVSTAGPNLAISGKECGPFETLYQLRYQTLSFAKVNFGFKSQTSNTGWCLVQELNSGQWTWCTRMCIFHQKYG